MKKKKKKWPVYFTIIKVHFTNAVNKNEENMKTKKKKKKKMKKT